LGLFKNLQRKFENMVRKPEGFLGKIMIRIMNSGDHAALSEWGFSHLTIHENAACLDLGCGGGANVERLLKYTGGHVTGLDYSELSVSETRKRNKAEIEKGRCSVVRGNVACLPFEDETFDVITAFETIYFWPGLESCFAGVYRCLKKGGVFMIVNECAGHKEENLKYQSMIDGMVIYTSGQIKDALISAGFKDIYVDEIIEKDHICVLAYK